MVGEKAIKPTGIRSSCAPSRGPSRHRPAEAAKIAFLIKGRNTCLCLLCRKVALHIPTKINQATWTRTCRSLPRISASPNALSLFPIMSSTSFTSPFGVNAHPVSAVRMQPGNMARVTEEDDNATSPTMPSFGGPYQIHAQAASPFGRDATSDRSPFPTMRNPEEFPKQFNFGRRTSVSAESLKQDRRANGKVEEGHRRQLFVRPSRRRADHPDS
jgi:hypothetical protein